MSILFQDAHNIDKYDKNLAHNHDHQINHLANEVAHNLRFSAFGCHTADRLQYAKNELAFDSQHLSKEDFTREVYAIQNKLPNRDFQFKHDNHGNISSIEFN